MERIKKRLYIAQNVDETTLCKTFRFFHIDEQIKYRAFCDDFGPMNLSSIVQFVNALDDMLNSFPKNKIVLCVKNGKRNMTNAIFLLGSYIVLKEDMPPQRVAANFSRMDTALLEPYRDATFTKADFNLLLVDCWAGLYRGKQQGWVLYAASGCLWGKTNILQYQNYDDPGNGNLQEVVPGKFIAFRSPLDLGDREFFDTEIDVRLFSPTYFIDIFQDMGVTTIVCLNEPRYDADAFTSHGFQHFDLTFRGSTCPPNDVVAAFFRIVDAAPGAVAVHCNDGRGRTGTLIALWLMRSHGFTAREAMGWLRIMRPGSVIGEQQRYLCSVEASALIRGPPGPASQDTAALNTSQAQSLHLGRRPLRGILRTKGAIPAVAAAAAAASPGRVVAASAGARRRVFCLP